MPWKLNTWDAYQQSCARCEIYVTVSSRQEYVQIKKSIHYDKKEKGNKGPCLTKDIFIGGRQLKTGDRLEPCPEMPDIMQIWNIPSLPRTILFWRCSNEVMARHRNPLFRNCDPYRVLTIDVLHGLHLGPMQSLVKEVFHVALVSNAWCSDYQTLDEQFTVSVDRLRSDLFYWYKKIAPKDVTRLGDLTKKMVGTRNHPQLKTKAMETWGLLLYCDHLIRSRPNIVTAKMKIGVESMIGIVSIMRNNGMEIPQQQLQVRTFVLGLS